tara:strand:- start:420 stop:923 length:504 start_codon:yes stop_codon:yes gene_type:complete
MNKEEVPVFLKKIPDDMNLEINVSCPNTEEKLVDKDLHLFLNKKRRWCIIKLSPLITYDKIDYYYSIGFRQFHCSNTLPIYENRNYRGGLSGESLIGINKKTISYIKEKYGEDVEVIAGGGITNMKILDKYKRAGADHFSVSSAIFNPLNFAFFYINYVRKLNGAGV